MIETSEELFPAFRRFVTESGLIDTAKGSLAARIPRILGQGRTKSIGYDAPPAAIERKYELAGLRKSTLSLPADVLIEIGAAESDIEQVRNELLSNDGQRKFAVSILRLLGDATSVKDNRYCAEGLILEQEKSGLEWCWSVTPHYPIIKRLPPDRDFIVGAHRDARAQIERFAVPANEFESRLRLAWNIARHFSDSDDVLVTDVMRAFNVAAQSDTFWRIPKRQNYVDLPDAAFVLSWIASKRFGSSTMAGLDFIPATLHQASGKNATVFYLPTNAEGTEVRPMIYLRPRN